MAEILMANERAKKESKVSFMMHRGAHLVDREVIEMAPLPAENGTYAVIPHRQVIELVENRVFKEFPNYRQEWTFAATKEGARMFAALKLRDGNADHGPAIALRNSYDRSMSFGFCCGLSLFICDNLALRGDFITYNRKHTGGAYEEAKSKLISGIIQLEDRYVKTAQDLERMQGAPLSARDGWEMIGNAQGQGILTPRLAAQVFRAWKGGEDDRYGTRSVYRLVNHMTEVLKQAPLQTMMGRLAAAHALGIDQMERGKIDF